MHAAIPSDSVVTQHAAALSGAIAAWPAETRLALVRAADPAPDAGTAPRWTILTAPVRATPIHDPAELPNLLAPRAPSAASPGPAAPPFSAGRLLVLSYELGAALEPTASPRKRGQPLGFVLDCPGALAFDHRTGAWSRVGHPEPPLPDPDCPRADASAFTIGQLRSESGRDAYTRAVRKALDYIRAGDVYQVNLAHRLSAPFSGSPRALMSALLDTADPACAFYAEIGIGEQPGTDALHLGTSYSTGLAIPQV